MLKPSERTTHIALQLLFSIGLCLGCAGVYAGQALRSERVVVVQPGETLSEIVDRELRSAMHWSAVARHNNIQDAALISAGQSIRIPLTYTRSNEHAIVLFAKGGAVLRGANPDRDARLKSGDEVRVGDEIRTNEHGFASIEFSSGSIINIQPNSHISIVDLSCKETDASCVIELYAEKGEVQSRVNHRPNQPVEFKIETPSGAAAVRGTVFDVGASSVRSVTGVTHGKVDMSAEGITAGVAAGYGVVTAIASAPGTPKMLLEPPALKSAPIRLAKGDQIYWWGNAEAESYDVTISRDLEATAVESTTNITDSSFVVPVALQGQHYINIRSIDIQGLKGMPTSLAVELVSIEPAKNTPIVSAELLQTSAAFTLETGVQTGALGYEIQLANNPEFGESESFDVDVGQGVVISFSDDKVLWSRARALFEGFKVGKYSEAVRVSR